MPRTRRRYAPRLPPEERRAQLLDAALAIIVERGYQAVSIEAVAREAGVTRPVVYDHFGDLLALLYALLERQEQIALGQLDAIIVAAPFEGDPDDVLRRGVRGFLGAVLERPRTWHLILLPVQGTPSLMHDHLGARREQVLARVEEVVGWGLERRGGPDLDVELTARSILALAEEAGRLVLTDPGRFGPERFDAFVSALLQALPRTARAG